MRQKIQVTSCAIDNGYLNVSLNVDDINLGLKSFGPYAPQLDGSLSVRGLLRQSDVLQGIAVEFGCDFEELKEAFQTRF